MVGEEAIAPLRAWLREVATDHQVRTALVRQTLRGTVTELVARAERVAAGLDAQRREEDQLLRVVQERYAAAAAAVTGDIREGALIRGEVLARWQDLIGAGDLGRMLQSTLGRLRDKLGSMFSGRPAASDQLHHAVESATELVVRARADEAAAAVAARWADDPAGQALLDGAPAAVDRASPELGERAGRLVRDWQAALVQNLRDKGAGKRSAARALSYGVNGLALVVMMAVFASTGGLTGTEAIIAGGSSTVGAKLLEALLGDQVIRRLVEDARTDLDRRVAELMGFEAQRFERLVRPTDGGGQPGGADPAAALRAAAEELQRRMGSDR